MTTAILEKIQQITLQNIESIPNETIWDAFFRLENLKSTAGNN